MDAPDHSTLNLILGVVAAALMAFLFAPRVIVMNRGKILQNIAIWLAIFVVLAWVYQNFGFANRAGAVRLETPPAASPAPSVTPAPVPQSPAGDTTPNKTSVPAGTDSSAQDI